MSRLASCGCGRTRAETDAAPLRRQGKTDMKIAAGLTLGLVLAVAGAARAQTAPEELRAVLHDYDLYYTSNDPIGAGQRGDLKAAAIWPDVSPTADARNQATERTLKARLD